MYTFIELWRPRPTWLALDEAERSAYMEAVGAGMAELTAAGIEVVGWGKVDAEPDGRSSGYHYIAVWRMPSPAEVEKFRATVREARWYDYFDQVNVASALGAAEAVIGEHIGL